MELLIHFQILAVYTVDVWEWVRNSMPPVITHSCRDESYDKLMEGAADCD